MKRLNLKQVLNWLSELRFGFVTGCVVGVFSVAHLQHVGLDSGLSVSDSLAVGIALQGVVLGFVAVLRVLSFFSDDHTWYLTSEEK